MAGPTGSNDFSQRRRVRSMEKAALEGAMERAHERGNHDTYEKRDCPRCDFDGPRPERRVEGADP